MKPIINLLRLDNCPILKQLQLEEALLRTDQRNWCVINEGTTDAIVMGISGKQNALINHERFHTKPISVIRRFSGGGCVYVDQDTLFVTLILNQESVPPQPFPQQILCWTKKIYQPLIQNQEFCIRENDYVIGEHKFGGNAQYIIKKRWLHHSSLLWDYCSKKMEYLSLPSKRPDYRKNRSHDDFLCTLKPLFPNRSHFWNQLEDSLTTLFNIEHPSLEEALQALEQPHRKATTLVEFSNNQL